MVALYDQLNGDDQLRMLKLRELAKTAPIDHDTVASVYGRRLDPAFSDSDRAGFMGVWGMLAYEWAEGVLAADEALMEAMINGYTPPVP